MGVKVELNVIDVINRVSGEMLFIVILREKDGHRHIPITVGPMEAQSIACVLNKIKLPRPTMHELFIDLSNLYDIDLKAVEIYKIENGTFYSYLQFWRKGVGVRLDSRTSDAITLALIYRVPIFIDEELLQANHMQMLGSGAVSMPLTLVGLETLRAALVRAVENEDYELASKLRDEIATRRETT